MMRILEASSNEADGLHGPSGVETLHLTPALRKAVTDGLEVDIVELAEDNPCLRMAYCAQVHDDSTNRVKATTLKDLVVAAVSI